MSVTQYPRSAAFTLTAVKAVGHVQRAARGLMVRQLALPQFLF